MKNKVKILALLLGIQCSQSNLKVLYAVIAFQDWMTMFLVDQFCSRVRNMWRLCSKPRCFFNHKPAMSMTCLSKRKQ